MKILLEGPILTQSGYGEHTRLIHRALSSDARVSVFVKPTNWGRTSWLNQNNIKNRQMIERDIHNFHIFENKEESSFDLHVHVGILNEYKRLAQKSICVTAGIETDRVSREWLIKTYDNCPDKIIVPSHHAKDSFVNSKHAFQVEGQAQEISIGYNKDCKIEVIPYPVKNVTPKDIDIKLETSFNFLTIAILGHRKNIENMINWFLEEFKDQDVGLVLKTCIANGSTIDREATISHLTRLVKSHKNRKCKVYLLHGDLTENEIHSLYCRDDIHAYVTTTHGEGFGLPIFEAAYSALPVVATDWSGHLDFLEAPYKQKNKVKNKKLFARVAVDLKNISEKAVWDGILIKGSRWAYPQEQSFKKQIREMVKNYGLYKKWAKHLQAHILEHYGEKKNI